MSIHRVTYGPGGHDPAKPNNNIVAEDELPTTPDFDNLTALQAAVAQALAADQAIIDNAQTYLAITSPTSAQAIAQVTALTQGIALLARNQRRIIRLLTEAFDASN